MNIVVCVKQVPRAGEVSIDPDTGTLMREGVESEVNPLDLHAVEAAVRLRERLGGRVTALSMGPPQAEEAVREAVARGCDEGVLLSDRAFAGSDTWATSFALAGAIRHIGDVDLALCGKQATDGDTAQVGPELAAHLGWTQATYVCSVQGAYQSGLVVDSLTDTGIETLRVGLPAVLTVLKDLNQPRLTSLPARMHARRCSVRRMGAEDLPGDPRRLGLDGSPTRVVEVHSPPERAQGTVWHGADEETINRLADLFREAELLT